MVFVMHKKSPQASSQSLSTYLVDDGLVAKDAMQKALVKTAQQNVSLTSYLVRAGIVSSEQILACCIKYFDLPHHDLSYYDEKYLQDPLINPELLHRHR